jgi:hypothetical protein
MVEGYVYDGYILLKNRPIAAPLAQALAHYQGIISKLQHIGCIGLLN